MTVTIELWRGRVANDGRLAVLAGPPNPGRYFILGIRAETRALVAEFRADFERALAQPYENRPLSQSWLDRITRTGEHRWDMQDLAWDHLDALHPTWDDDD